MLAVRTAKEDGIRPCTFLFNEPSDEWCEVDSNLLVALSVLESERCSECGEYVWVCRDTSPFSRRFHYETNSSTCFKTKAQREKQNRFDTPLGERGAKTKEDRERERKDGVIITVRPVLKEGQTAPTRKEYYEWIKENDYGMMQYEESDERQWNRAGA